MAGTSHWHFLFKEKRGVWLCLFLCLLPRGGIQRQNLGGGSYLLAGAFVIPTSFVRFSSLKCWDHPCPSEGYKGFLCAFSSFKRRILLCNFNVIIADELWATNCNIVLLWNNMYIMRQRPCYLISSSGYFAPAPHFSFPLFNLKCGICYSIKFSHLRCLSCNLLSDLTSSVLRLWEKVLLHCIFSIFILQASSMPHTYQLSFTGSCFLYSVESEV